MSETGDDGASGESPDDAWQTIERVNAAALVATDTVLFEAGGTFLGELNARCAIGSYGSGPRPVLALWTDLSSGWEEHESGIWKVALDEPNMGYLVADGDMKTVRRWSLETLASDWDFYADATHLYVSLSADPSAAVSDLRGAADGLVVRIYDGAHIDGIEVTGCGGHGMAGNASDVEVRNCKVHLIGGAEHSASTRYGNGIETWIGSDDWLVEDNEIAECYDAGYTAQGTQAGNNRGWEDIAVRSNHIHHCSQSVEFWSAGSDGEGFVNVVVEDNTCEDAGGGWGAAVRPDPEKIAHILTYAMELPSDITIEGNVFHRSTGSYRYSSEDTGALVSQGNDIALEAGTLMQYQDTETIEDAAAWATANNTEQGSTFTVL